MKCILSIDVEDWFHILDTPATPHISEWPEMVPRINQNMNRLFEILGRYNVKATLFFLGWIAEQYPELVEKAKSLGFEISSHGYAHELVYNMDENSLLKDMIKSKSIIEKITGEQVKGFRASGFSVTRETPWFFKCLKEAGYLYDSSIFPAEHGHGGYRTELLGPYKFEMNSHNIFEFPISVKKIAGRNICFFGGGYLRFFPYVVIRQMIRSVLKENRPVIIYLHPREIDPQHPRLPMSIKRQFKSYYNLNSTKRKLERLLEDFEFITFDKYIKEYEIPIGK